MLKHTVCRLCSACCPVEAEVESGKLISAERKSFPAGPERINCPKLMRAAEITYSPNRLKSPLVRDDRKGGGSFREAGWDEALDLVASRFLELREKEGARSVAWLRGMAADWGAPWDYAQRLMNAFGSPNSIGNGSVCHVAREMAHIYTYGAMTFPRVKDSRCIVVWGKNDRNTSPGAHEALLAARKQGAALIVVDPVKTPAARIADIWLQVKPAHDGQLAMAMIHEIIAGGLYDRDFVENHALGFDALKEAAMKYPPDEVAASIWLDPERIRQAAGLYASTKPACIVDGNGLDMQLHTFQATRAVAVLRALTGNLDIEGGDFIPQPPALRNIQLRDRIPAGLAPVTADYKLFGSFHDNWGLHAQSKLIDAVLDEDPYPVKALVVQSGNPAMTMTDSGRVRRALAKLDFVVVIDPFLTRTAEFADVVLPASLCFEKTQLNRASMRNCPVILQDRIIDPLPGTWPDWKITFQLAGKLGLGEDFPWEDVDEAIDYQLEPSGITIRDLRANPNGLWDGEVRFKKYLSGGFATPSGKVEFYSDRLEREGHHPVPYMDGARDNPISFSGSGKDETFVGISGERENRFTHTQFHHVTSLLKPGETPKADLHVDDAERLGISEGDTIAVKTPRGRVTMAAGVTDRIRPGVVRIAWGWGEVDDNWNLNLLTDDDIRDPVTCTPSSRSFMCSVEKSSG